MALYLCFRCRIFDKLVVEGHISQVEKGPHLLQSCLCASQDGLAPTAREMHLCFESLAITHALGLHASLMDIHHDTSLRSILEDESISLAPKLAFVLVQERG